MMPESLKLKSESLTLNLAVLISKLLAPFETFEYKMDENRVVIMRFITRYQVCYPGYPGKSLMWIHLRYDVILLILNIVMLPCTNVISLSQNHLV